jgi:hypothetical protein
MRLIAFNGKLTLMKVSRALTREGHQDTHDAMLQRNTHGAHLAHAAVVSLHAVCCGAPMLALLATSIWGAASALAVFGAWIAPAHAALHGFELWTLAASSFLVVLGGALEWRASRDNPRRGLSWLFGVSVGCFVVNATLIGAHYLAHF